MRWYCRRKVMLLAAMTAGTALQLAACREEAALLGLRTVFTSFTLPFNQFIRQLLLSLS